MDLRRNILPGLAHLSAEVKFRLRTSWNSPWRLVADRVADRITDKKLGIASSECRSLAELGLNLQNCNRYQPISYSDLRRILDSISISNEDVFLDFGSGMGRALCVAAQYPFRAVLGVEISTELCAAARRNVEQARSKLLCKDVRVLNTDAVQYEVPAEVSTIYFFNPFGRTILARVFGNLAISLREAPRHMTVVFYGTAASEAFREEAAGCGWLELRSTLPLPTGAIALVYSNTRWTEGASLLSGAKGVKSADARV
jgi:predicted RNA methylase